MQTESSAQQRQVSPGWKFRRRRLTSIHRGRTDTPKEHLQYFLPHLDIRLSLPEMSNLLNFLSEFHFSAKMAAVCFVIFMGFGAGMPLAENAYKAYEAKQRKRLNQAESSETDLVSHLLNYLCQAISTTIAGGLVLGTAEATQGKRFDYSLQAHRRLNWNLGPKMAALMFLAVTAMIVLRAKLLRP